MNTVTISGRLTKDATQREVGETTVTGFSVADNRFGKDKGANFWDCSFWGKPGAAVGAYLTKGRHITVTGSLETVDVKDEKAYIRVRVDRVDIGPKQDAGPTQEDF